MGHDAGRLERRRQPRRSRDDVGQLVRFTRDAGIYEAQSKGHGNHYQLFAERAVSLLRPGGRLGLVLPSGFATDQGSSALRRLVFSQCAVDGLVGFEQPPPDLSHSSQRSLRPHHRDQRITDAAFRLPAGRGRPGDPRRGRQRQPDRGIRFISRSTC